MSQMYATVTSKGQITLPVQLRRALGIQPGQIVAFRQAGATAVMQPADDVESVRSAIEKATRRNGTWGAPLDVASPWRESTVRRHASA